MKRSIVWLTAAICAFTLLFSACQPPVPDEPSSSSSQENSASGNTEDNSQQPNSSEPSENSKPSSDTGKLPGYQPGSIKLTPQDRDDYDFDRKYRITYYRIWGEFSELLSEKEFEDYMVWADEESKKTGYGKNRNEMLLVSFIKHYNISREEFDKAVQKFTDNCKSQGWDTTEEEYEIPNGDIIYTFDNEIINRYYRYE